MYKEGDVWTECVNGEIVCRELTTEEAMELNAMSEEVE